MVTKDFAVSEAVKIKVSGDPRTITEIADEIYRWANEEALSAAVVEANKQALSYETFAIHIASVLDSRREQYAPLIRLFINEGILNEDFGSWHTTQCKQLAIARDSVARKLFYKLSDLFN